MKNKRNFFFYFVAPTFFLSSFSFQGICAEADFVCKLNGKLVDIYDSSQKSTFNGVVACRRKTMNDELILEKHTFAKGLRITEEIDSKARKYIHRFTHGNGNEWLHGEQIDYFPGTEKVKLRETYEKMHRVGLSEEFYNNGKIKERSYYTHHNPKRGSEQTASMGYNTKGELSFVRCGKTRSTTIDPKLCGFDGKSSVAIKTEEGNTIANYTFSNGENVQEIVDAAPESRWASLLTRGTVASPKAAKVKSEVVRGGRRMTWLYADGRVKRSALVTEQDKIDGEDEEYFSGGALARKTVFDSGQIIKSQCWWQNGKPRAKIERVKAAQGSKTPFEYVATYTWDNGTIETSGRFSIPDFYYDRSDQEIETMISCERRHWSLREEGPHELRRRDGTLISSGSYIKGEPVGWHKQYDDKGELSREELYVEKSAESEKYIKQVKQYIEGKLASDQKFNSDGSEQEK